MASSTTVDDFADIDDATAALLIQLQIEDLDELIDRIQAKGKSPEGVISDAELAFQLERKELQRNLTIISDRQMTKSIARAVMTDAQALTIAATQENDEADDRALALRTHRVEGGYIPLAITAPPTAAAPALDPDDEFIDKLAALYIETPMEDPGLATALVKYDLSDTAADVTSLTSATGALVLYNPNVDIAPGEASASRQVVKIDKRECVICLDNVVFFEVARLPCGHECCRRCLLDMFTAAIVDESRYPPQCCDTIPSDAKEVRLFLPGDVIKQFDEKKIEWDSKDRTYCSNLECGIFICSEHVIPGLATCPACHTLTCSICKERAHDGICPKDEAMQQTLQLLQENGWRRCESCRNGVELKYGCYHITAEFCYLCGATWKTCTCEQWNEERLLDRAEDIADRGRLRVHDAAQRLRLQADCQHQHNHRLRQPDVCEDCHQFMRIFIMECTRCFLRRCLRCA